MGFIKQKNEKTYYQVLGRGSGIPVICLHGGPGGTHRYFRELETASLKRKAIVYDQIGSGRSSALKQKDQTIEVLVRNLAHLISELELNEFHLFGTSWGATLALEYYFRKNGRGVRSLILQSPLISTKIWERDAKMLLSKFPKKTQNIIKVCTEVGATDSKVYKAAEKEFYKKHLFRGKPDKQNIDYFKRYPNEHGGELYNHMWGPSEFVCSGTLKKYDRLADLKKISVPTLYLAGQFDEVTKRSLSQFQKATPNSQSRIISNASHTILRENPKPMIKVLSQFMAEVDESKYG